jgi:Ca2+-dependent lipid-binding protein
VTALYTADLSYEPVLSQTIVASVDAVLVDNCPSFLESIRLTTFTLGTKAPRIDYVRTFPKTPDDVVIMDWAISFTPTDLQDITPRQAQDKVNPKIVLAIRVGKGAVSKALPILLEDMSFTGRMRIKLKLMTNFPHVQAIDMSFIEKPTFDYVLKSLGGETFGFDINHIPGLAPFIREQVHANLGPMMYDPNVFTIDLAALLSGTPLDAAIGVLKITVNDARGLKAVKLGGGAPDPYVAIALGAKPPVAQTQTVPSTSNPSFQSTHFLLINTLGDMLTLSLYDYNDHRPDNLLGAVTQELGTLAEDAEQQHVGKIIGGGKDRGELRYDLSYFPVLTPTKNPDGTFEPLPDVQTGIVRLTIHQAKDFDRRELNPFARVLLGKQTVHKTPVLKHTSQPIWESHVEFLVPEKHTSVVTVQVYNSKDYDPHLGSLSVRLTDLLEARARSQDWFPLAPKGKVRLTAEWKPVAMTGSLSGAAVYTPPIGILRIWLKSASDVKNVEAALGGKSDPYVRVMGANKILARTEVVDNNLNPQWDQIVYVPVHSGRENLMLELMDYQNIGKDRSLGYVELKVGDCVEPRDDIKYPYASRGHQVHNERIKLSNGYKGTLSFEVDFKPAVALRDVSFEAEKNELELAAEATAAENGEPLGNGAPSPAPEKPGISMDTDSLLRAQSGILVFQVVSGSLARRGSLEVMLDDGYWPSFVSSRARSNTQKWDQIGEGFVRELDFSRIWFRLNAADDSEKEDIVAEFRCDIKEFLELCLGSPQEFLLSQADGSNRSVVTISARYVPVDIVLEPRESINSASRFVSR